VCVCVSVCSFYKPAPNQNQKSKAFCVLAAWRAELIFGIYQLSKLKSCRSSLAFLTQFIVGLLYTYDMCEHSSTFCGHTRRNQWRSTHIVESVNQRVFDTGSTFLAHQIIDLQVKRLGR